MPRSPRARRASAGETLARLVASLHARGIHVALARPEPTLLRTLDAYELRGRIDPDHVYSDLDVAIAAFAETTRRPAPGK